MFSRNLALCVLALSAVAACEGAADSGSGGGAAGGVADSGGGSSGGAVVDAGQRDAGPTGGTAVDLGGRPDLGARPDRGGPPDLGSTDATGAGGQSADLGANGGTSPDAQVPDASGGTAPDAGRSDASPADTGAGGAPPPFERFELFSAAGPCPDEMDCVGRIVLEAAGRLMVDRFGELPVVEYEAQVPADRLAAAIEVLTEPALVALLDLPAAPCEPPFDIFEHMSLTLGGAVHENDTTFCDDAPLAAARDVMFGLVNTFVPPAPACAEDLECFDDASCPAIGGCDLDVCTVDVCGAGRCSLGAAAECTTCADTCTPDGQAAPAVCDCGKFGDDPAGLAAFDFVEFCVPAPGDAEAQATALLPGLQCSGARGRIGCDPAVQRLCIWEAPRAVRQGPLPCGAWDALCQLSRLRSVHSIRGSFFE